MRDPHTIRLSSEGVLTGGDPQQVAGRRSLGDENASHGNSPRYETGENGITAMNVDQARQLNRFGRGW